LASYLLIVQLLGLKQVVILCLRVTYGVEFVFQCIKLLDTGIKGILLSLHIQTAVGNLTLFLLQLLALAVQLKIQVLDLFDNLSQFFASVLLLHLC